MLSNARFHSSAFSGASGGLGSAIAKLFSERKAKLALVDIDSEGLERVSLECTSIQPTEVRQCIGFVRDLFFF